MRAKGVCGIEAVFKTFKIFTCKTCNKVYMDMNIIKAYKFFDVLELLYF